jgi:hypothetical protein
LVERGGGELDHAALFTLLQGAPKAETQA